ncbi:MAG: hypothetical protein ACRDRP_16590 [Pseudonocardiaceae bacterium]
MSPRVPQVGGYDELLRAVLRAAVEAGPGGAGGIDSIQHRACAALYALLSAHPVDRRGRCRSCRRPGAVFGFRRRHCGVHGQARVWLGQPEWFLRSRLVSELSLTDREPAPDSVTPTPVHDPGDTDVAPGIEPDPGDQRSAPVQTPAASPSLAPCRCPRARRPDLETHGGAGDDPPHGPRSRRVPPDNPIPPRDQGYVAAAHRRQDTT